MISIDSFREMVMMLPEVSEAMHFDKPSFRIKNKIFATIHVAEKKVMVRLSLADQFVFSSMDKESIYPVPGGWGRRGATFVKLDTVKKEIVKELLQISWSVVATKTLQKRYFPDLI